MQKKRGFVPITVKVNSIILASLVVGIGAITFYLASSIFTTIDDATVEGLDTQSDLLYEAVEQLMLPGEAPLAVQYFEGIATINPDYRINLYRREGQRAFTDNETIEEVNANIGPGAFPLREPDPDPPRKEVVGMFAEAITTPAQTVTGRETVEGNSYFRIYRPLLNLPKCTVCHGSDHTIRGVIDIRSNITESVTRQRFTVVTSSGLFFGVVVLLSLVLSQFLRRTVLAPVSSIGEVCSKVTMGDFSPRVEISNNDEIGRLGDTVNKMVTGLHERYELSKFVSNSTLRSLGGEEGSGQRSVVTLFFSDIRGFTSYSERTDSQDVVEYLNRILNVQSEIIQRNGGDIDKYVGDEIVALFAGNDAEEAACRSAVEIQRELIESSDSHYSGLAVGIGINTGEVILGMIGSETRADFTVIGDNVNVASRLCSAAGRGEILVSESVAEVAGRIFQVEGPFRLKVKGKEEFQRVYKVLSSSGDES